MCRRSEDFPGTVYQQLSAWLLGRLTTSLISFPDQRAGEPDTEGAGDDNHDAGGDESHAGQGRRGLEID